MAASDSRLSGWRLAVETVHHVHPKGGDPSTGTQPVSSDYVARYWGPILSPTGVQVLRLLTECHLRAIARGEREPIEVDAGLVAAACGIGTDLLWRTLNRLDRVSHVSLRPAGNGLNVVTIPLWWPPVKRDVSDRVDAALDTSIEARL